jgi:hypothetical protein
MNMRGLQLTRLLVKQLLALKSKTLRVKLRFVMRVMSMMKVMTHLALKLSSSLIIQRKELKMLNWLIDILILMLSVLIYSKRMGRR